MQVNKRSVCYKLKNSKRECSYQIKFWPWYYQGYLSLPLKKVLFCFHLIILIDIVNWNCSTFLSLSYFLSCLPGFYSIYLTRFTRSILHICIMAWICCKLPYILFMRSIISSGWISLSKSSCQDWFCDFMHWPYLHIMALLLRITMPH